jgi:hypothetical protein
VHTIKPRVASSIQTPLTGFCAIITPNGIAVGAVISRHVYYRVHGTHLEVPDPGSLMSEASYFWVRRICNAEHRPKEPIQSEDIGEWLFVSEALLSFSLHFANG